MDYGAILGLLSSIGGGVAGQAASADDRAQARRIFNLMIQKYGDVKTPQLQDEKAQELGPSALEGIQTDPELRSAELGSLGSLKQIQDMGGLTLEDRASLNDIQNQLARHESAGRSAISNDFAARGQLGSGAQLAMALQNEQDSANRGAQQGMNTAAQAQKRYFDSILQRGNMAGQMDARDYQRKSDAARAHDSIAAHNAAARSDAARYNNNIRNQGFSNQLALAGGQSGAGVQQANFLGNEANRTAQLYAKLGAAGNKAINTGGGSSNDSGYGTADQVPDDDYLSRMSSWGA